jgi:hypothetical protein
VFGVYLIHKHCLEKTSFSLFVIRFAQLASIALLMLAAAFGPIVISSYFQSECATSSTSPSSLECFKLETIRQLHQIFSRLFPFGRGLVHAYWAPNIWALYCFLDKLLTIISKRYLPQLLRNVTTASSSSSLASTSGLVGEFAFNVLPQISPSTSLLLVIIAISPAVWKLHVSPSSLTLTRAVVYSSMSYFMLGYHVHEKAILTPLICQTLLLAESSDSAALYLELALAGAYSLFPLFTNIQELFSKCKSTDFFVK